MIVDFSLFAGVCVSGYMLLECCVCIVLLCLRLILVSVCYGFVFGLYTCLMLL